MNKERELIANCPGAVLIERLQAGINPKNGLTKGRQCDNKLIACMPTNMSIFRAPSFPFLSFHSVVLGFRRQKNTRRQKVSEENVDSDLLIDGVTDEVEVYSQRITWHFILQLHVYNCQSNLTKPC